VGFAPNSSFDWSLPQNRQNAAVSVVSGVSGSRVLNSFFTFIVIVRQLGELICKSPVAFLHSDGLGTRLLAAMDELNNKYGMSTLAPSTMLTAYKAAPTRIAFHSTPDLFGRFVTDHCAFHFQRLE
jgi:hypothetical protein